LDLQRSIRVNLAGWRPRLHSLRACLETPVSVRLMALSPDGRVILTASGDGTVQRWEPTGRPLGTPLPRQGEVHALAFSPDGKTFAVARTEYPSQGAPRHTAQLYRTATGAPVSAPLRHQRPVHALAFSPDGKTLATCAGAAQLWNVAMGEAGVR